MIPNILKPLILLLASAAIASAQIPPVSSTPEEQARFLAVILLPRQSALAPLQQSPEYRPHQKTVQD
jgi:hypothetical protein